MALTIKQLADLAGVSVRTLHYYDQINLLPPEKVNSNGYRQYNEASLRRLQQILFYRELGLTLEEIGRILDRPDFNELQALEQHRAALYDQIKRLQALVKTVDHTISHLKGESLMSQKEFFNGFNPEKQAEYEKEIAEKYGSDVLAASKKVWDASTPDERNGILAEGQAINLALVEAMPSGPGSPAAQAQVEAWRNYLSRNFWSPSDEQYLALGQGYAEHPDFRATYEAIQPGLADFLAKAIEIYIQNRKTGG
jgi:MerR family transcriptional regulator, thiopeptide resistance regulator